MKPLRILMAGNLHIPHSSENSVYRQLERDGHDVEKFIYPTLKGTSYNDLNKKLYDEIKKQKPDILLCGKVLGLTGKEINYIKNEFGCKCIQWIFDLIRHYQEWDRLNSWWLPQAKAFDVCFGAHGGEDDIKFYRENGVNYYPLKLGALPDWHTKVEYNEKINNLIGCDVSFLGGIYNPLRINMASRIQCIPKIKFNNFVGYELHGQIIPGVYMKQISQLATVCKISIGCNYRNDIEGYWSKRPYEVMGSNMFMIQAYVKGMEDEGFKDKVNTIFYHDDNFEEMSEKIEYYLLPENQDERERIKEAGFQLIHNFHMMSDRTKEFFKILKQNKVI